MKVSIYFSLVLLSSLFYVSAKASDLGFRYDPTLAQCLNSKGESGYNSGTSPIECAQLKGSSLSTRNLSGARLLGVKATYPVPVGCNFSCESYAHSDVIFTAADMRGFQADQTKFMNIDFSYANLEGASFRQSSFVTRGNYVLKFNGAVLRNVDFFKANFSHVSFEGADLRGANLKFATFDDCKFKGAVFNSFTQLPFSQDAALRMGMIEDENEYEVPLDTENLLAPPALAAIYDNRLFSLKEECGLLSDDLTKAQADCQKSFASDLLSRTVLITSQETTWNLIMKSQSGSLWQNSELDLLFWYEKLTKPTSLNDEMKFCTRLGNLPLLNKMNLKASVPSNRQIADLDFAGIHSLFPNEGPTQLCVLESP